MLRPIQNFVNIFFRKSRNINNEPINKVSLIVIIIVDLFILFNVFAGLDDISTWYLSPSQQYPCYSPWQTYQDNANVDRDFQIISDTFKNKNKGEETYPSQNEKHLGNVSSICVNFTSLQNSIIIPNNQEIFNTIQEKEQKINALENSNINIRNQYDSTLLEKIAGQPKNLSINEVEAQKAKQELEKNNQTINNLKEEIKQLKKDLLATPQASEFISFLDNEIKFNEVKKSYQNATFWYPSIQITFQLIFLLPLIFISLFVHNLSVEKGYGLMSLMSWHLLVIFFIPLLIKIFEFLQIGIIFKILLEFVTNILGGLLFLISYLYIFIIPAIGFGIIKFFQKIVFNRKNQASKRVEKSLCLNCAKKIHGDYHYCPHCGYGQLMECGNCHNLTYKFMPYCRHCGTSQMLNSESE